jgi:hypothetical protein
MLHTEKPDLPVVYSIFEITHEILSNRTYEKQHQPNNQLNMRHNQGADPYSIVCYRKRFVGQPTPVIAEYTQ